MAVQTRDTLKTWFESGDFPTQQQFWDFIDSYVHVNDVSTGPVPDDLKLTVGVDIAAALTEVELPILNGRRYRIIRNNVRMTSWVYKLVSGVRTGFIIQSPEYPTVADELFVIEFY
jgi:hypothetical protein